MKHYSVMCKEIIESLNIVPNGIYVDATLGYAGMSSKILEKLNGDGLLIGIDQDREAREYSNEALKKISDNYKIIDANFVDLKEKLEELGIKEINGIIFDLGFSSPQIDDGNRGFSFMKDAPLDMRMNLDSKLTAKEVVNNYKEEDLVKCFFQYGEEKLSRGIAKNITEARKNKEIETTLELVEIIKKAVGANYFYKNHPERKIFQALRIIVNNELEVLEKVLPDAIELLKKGGRMSVITFHSLEDRIVKNIFKENSEVNVIFKGLPDIPKEYQAKIKLVNKKPIEASKEEIEENSRSHSAKLRIVERI
ncbi:MAG: 16S rRNA (cytosine(1402)-N(4))-methyltransferase RsmH [Firmicutes bacterium]|nr:16S rRNA (cytosine(1402)-N(4))-methyltransferase RsmH [Bacillota bacterium]